MQQTIALLDKLKKDGHKITTAESCTGGLIAAAITAVPGVSKIFERGFITYSNDSKTEMLGVSKALIEKYGAVSEAVCREMALGALAKANADIAISTTGIAGPDGGSKEKPVGLVYIGVATKKRVVVIKNNIPGSRIEVQHETLIRAIQLAAHAVDAI